MRQKGALLERITLGMDLPSEALPGQPLVELMGESRVLVENHRGVSLYSRDEIIVKVSYGQLRVCGCGLTLACMTKQRLIIAGRIDGLSLLRGG